MKENWRDHIEDSLRKHIELQIAESFKHRYAYEKSQNPSNSQIWIAIANLSKQLFETNLRIKFLEKTLYDINQSLIERDLEKKKRRK